MAGRGGAGFPTWFKWEAAYKSRGDKNILFVTPTKAIGAFMDRAVIESDPHNLLEGMLIAAYVISAGEAIIYVRAEYPLAITRWRRPSRRQRRRTYRP